MFKSKKTVLGSFEHEAQIPFTVDDDQWMSLQHYTLSKTFKKDVLYPYEVIPLVFPKAKYIMVDSKYVKISDLPRFRIISNTTYEKAIAAKLSHPIFTKLLPTTRGIPFDNPVLNRTLEKLRAAQTKEVAKLKIIEVAAISKEETLELKKFVLGLRRTDKFPKGITKKGLKRFFKKHLPHFYKKYIFGWLDLVGWEHLLEENPKLIDIISGLSHKLGLDYDCSLIMALVIYYSKLSEGKRTEVSLVMKKFPHVPPQPPTPEVGTPLEGSLDESGDEVKTMGGDEDKGDATHSDDAKPAEPEGTKDIEALEVTDVVTPEDGTDVGVSKIQTGEVNSSTATGTLPPKEPDSVTRKEMKESKTVWGIVISGANQYIQPEDVITGDTYFVDGMQVLLLFTYDPLKPEAFKESLMKVDHKTIKTVRFLEDNIRSIPGAMGIIEEIFDLTSTKYKILPYMDGVVKEYIPPKDVIKRLPFPKKNISKKIMRNIVYASLFREPDRTRIASILESKKQSDAIDWLNKYVVSDAETRKNLITQV